MAPSIDYKKVLSSWARQHNLDINVTSQLSKCRGKEEKLFLALAKQHDKPNPLNGVFLSRLESVNINNHRAVTELYLSVFYPSDLNQVGVLMKQYKGKEEELIGKLKANFNACDAIYPSSKVDYNEILTKFLNKADPERVGEVESTLEKCHGRETILFAVLSKEYGLPNPLNDVFVSRVGSIDSADYLALTKLYLSIFNPKIAFRAEAFLRQYQRREAELFAKLADKFYAINPLDIPGVGNRESALTTPVKGCAPSNSIIQAQQSPGIVA